MFSSIHKKYFYFGLLICLIIIATVISSSYSRDSIAYNGFITRYGRHGWERFLTEALYLEAFFIFLSKIIVKINFDYIFVFLIHSIISLSLKFYLVCKYSKDKLLSLSFFCSYFFILHDSTQIRFGMAVAFVYLGLHYLSEKKQVLFSVIVIASALLFHTAIIVFLIMLFFTTRKSLYWLIGLVLFAVLIYPIDLNAIMLSVVENVMGYLGPDKTRFDKLYALLLQPSLDVFLGVFRPIPLLVYFCAIVIYQYRDKFSAYEMLCYNALLLSIFFYILLKDILELQVRFADMFGFSLVFLVPYVHRGISEYIGEKYAYIILYSFFIVHLVKFTLYDKMLIL